ncbi:MAG: MlaD family protein, partial [Thermocrispum sp.]
MSSSLGPGRIRILAMAAVLLLVAGASAWLVVLNDRPHRVTAYFTGTVGLYRDSDVRILGVSVGTVDDVVP